MHKLKRILLALSAVSFTAILSTNMLSFAQGDSTTLQSQFTAAAQEFNVPVSVLLGVAYNESHFESPSGMSSDGGYGTMDLRTYVATTVSARDGKQVTVPKQAANYYTLDQATKLLNESATTLETDVQQNIRGGAAVLAQDARQLNGGNLPNSVADWYSAVADFSGATSSTTASQFADDVFSVITSGTTLTTSTGQVITLPATTGVQPNKNTVSALGLRAMSTTPATGQPAECPTTLKCRFIPAAYAQDSPTDPTNYGNYDPANRPKDMSINYIYIHDGEGTYDSIINHFQDPTAYDSAQYVISSTGDITQMVTNEDVSWGVFNWHMNMHGINIEHEGFAAQGASWYTPAMYQASATLVRWLANKYHIPLDRQHILGHDNIMADFTSVQAQQHWDPGPFWNWNYYMDLVKGETPEQAAADYTAGSAVSTILPIRQGDVVTIAPHFATNQPVVTDCQTSPCVTLPKQGTDFVYLYSQPNTNASLLSDPYLHTDNSAGTTQDNDWGDKAPSGFKYTVAAVQGDWVGIWYAGQTGWFYNPHGSNQVAYRSMSTTITPKPGLSSVPVYTSAYPEASAYPSVIPVVPQDTPYTMAAGQSYVVDAAPVTSDYYYDATINYSLPDDHMIVVGKQKYYEISFNHHVGFVKVGDVVIK